MPGRVSIHAVDVLNASDRESALKFCFKTCVAMKFVDDDDDDDRDDWPL